MILKRLFTQRLTTPEGIPVEIQVGVEEAKRYNRDGHYPQVSIFYEDETVLDQFVNRRMRPVAFFRKKLMPTVLEAVGWTGARFSWNRRARCSCGCSPAFVVRHRLAKFRGLPILGRQRLFVSVRVRQVPKTEAEAKPAA